MTDFYVTEFKSILSIFQVNLKEIVDNIHICSICLGDASDDVNELIDCDECGISVHEGKYLFNNNIVIVNNYYLFLGCYGVHDSGSVSSSVSSCSMEPWFCEACKAGIENPTCELCPNFGLYIIIDILLTIFFYNLN